MAIPKSSARILPLAHAVLRTLVVLNWLLAAGIVLLLVVLPTRAWILTSLHLAPSAEADRVVLGLRSIALIGLATVPLNAVILKRLLAIVESVRARDPFARENAARLQAIAWALLGLQVLALVVGWIADGISTPAHPIRMDAGFSIGGWLAVLLTFLLARVFAEGTHLRDDLEGTV
jgi:hypothetical protein